MVPTVQEKSKQIFFAQPKAHQNKFADLNKMVLSNPLRMIAFFKQCQATNKVAGILDKIAPRIRSSQRKRKWLIFLPCVAVNQATVSIAVGNTATIIEVTNAIATIANLTIIIKTIDAVIALNVTTMTQKAPGPTTRRMIASAITPRKKGDEAMHNYQSAKLSARNLFGK
jgi:hypothetical protein